MRKLNFGDVFTAGRLIKAINAPEKVRAYVVRTAEILESGGDDDDFAELGINTVMEILAMTGSPAVENAAVNFLSGPFEMTAEQVKNLELTELISMVRQLAKENNLADFFGKAGKSVTL